MSIRNFDALFRPTAIALVGASNEFRSVGFVLARNLYDVGFAGPIMTVNPHEVAIQSAVNYRSVAELPVVPDLAVIATPAATVPGIVADLGRRGCRAAVVISAGFGPNDDPHDLRQQLLDAARPHLMRIVGPNCLGFMSSPRSINASFAHIMPRAGDIALVSQSGAIIAAMLDWADQRGIGFSHVVALGDMADVDFGDMLDHLCSDAATRSILMYVENITHARKFMSAARAAARTKPVIVVKAGRSTAGARAALSHTGALAGADAVYAAAFRRSGLLRVGKLEELFAAAATLATGLRVCGNRLAILTNGGGAGVLAVDELDVEKGQLAALGQAKVEQLDCVLPAAWSRGMPVDILGDADSARYQAALDVLLDDSDSDAVLVINCPTAVADGVDAARKVAVAAKSIGAKPILTSWLGGTTAAQSRAILATAGVPSFESPEEAVRAFSHLACFHQNQTLLLQTPGAGVAIGRDRITAARELLKRVRGEARTTLTEPESKTLLALFGIPTVETKVVETPADAACRFKTLKSPVALKILSPDIIHKSDKGGVALNLNSAAEVENAAQRMLENVRLLQPDARVAGFTIQPMILRPTAQELILGIAHDATFGPVILFGRGGTATEIIADRAIGLPPLNSVLAHDMIAQTEVSKLLAGFRNVPATPLEPIIDVLLRLSELVIQLDEISELDINPLLADSAGVIALDARIVVGERAKGPSRLAISPYPNHLEREIRLRDGTLAYLRPIRPEDETGLAEMVSRCTPDDLRKRFLAPLKTFPHEMAARLSQIDYDREMALVAVTPGSAYGSGPILGVVRIFGDPEREAAEYAILVRSDLKGRGLGYQLMSAIVDHARAHGYKRLHGEVFRHNTAMLQMASEFGFETQSSDAGNETSEVVLAL